MSKSKKGLTKVRFGIVGLGNMGRPHAKWIAGDKGRDIALGAVCDIVADKAQAVGAEHDVPHFTDAFEMIDSGLIDAVLIAVPHYWHAVIGIYAARKKIHVLCEKPVESRVGPARWLVEECKKNKVAMGVMLHHRSRAVMIKARQLIDAGEIGEVFRAQLVCSSWFRTQAYYDSGAWRGTWDGEGGGVLINQAPHHLDLYQWLAGMPRRVSGLIDTRGHNIEVEDTANFLLEYDGGKVGYIYATTAEEPGYEEFRLTGDKGTMVISGNSLQIGKLKMPVSQHIMGSKGTMGGAAGEQKCTWKDVKLPKDPGGKHIMITKAFAAHILRGKEMYIDGNEGVNELELSNAMYLAGYSGKPVDLPVDDKAIDRLIKKLERERSTGKGGGMRTEADKMLAKLARGAKNISLADAAEKVLAQTGKKSAGSAGKKASKKTAKKGAKKAGATGSTTPSRTGKGSSRAKSGKKTVRRGKAKK